MDTKGIEDVTIGELIELSKVLKMPFKEAIPIHKKWINDKGLTDKQGQKALKVSKVIVGY